ncbi:hypothetical protein DRF60_06730 [Chryseobacterium elymi]|uniref:Uncharacterized protein n=1 Tax=Chryseobacterium elymi TaxID=395936 RepID=A0A3D9DND5_9FLAO|nr:DUF6520 family protein [Chryseobacterium elymi]REC79512.1 hypothetical protein DRF60_06730 [Chryseobacterium elymi]
MKNFKLLLGAAVLFAVGSAFTTSNKAFAGEYVLIAPNTYELKTNRPAGECREMPSQICDYTKINPSGSNTDPNNFTPNTRNAQWVEGEE